jgi:alpha-tubulin suppressor-like RCC1 family protein
MEANNSNVLLLDDTGQIWALGRNNLGQLGDGTISDDVSCTPVAVDQSALGGWKAIQAVVAEYTILALDEWGRVWAWGEETRLFGDGTTGGSAGRPTPGQVPIPTDPSITSLSVSEIYANTYNKMSVLALDESGQLWGWGMNYFDVVGLGSNTSPIATPQKVNQDSLDGVGIVSMAMGRSHTLALDAEGRMWAWGVDDWGCFGSGDVQQAFTKQRVDDSALGDDPWLP